ncbi:MAG: hypothetical protein J0H15_11500 [Xanthomonadales bacterium]|nr:hypothetical protein [Xanthomonadales bacterium]
MNTHAIAALAVVAALFAGAAPAQAGSLRGLGLLAMNGDDAHGLGGPGRGSLVELPDSGGGSMSPRAVRGGDSALPARSGGASAPPSADEAGEPGFDPSAPAAQTPKRPSYRWQSLVPGAIK